jgi:hypothetical protein
MRQSGAGRKSSPLAEHIYGVPINFAAKMYSMMAEDAASLRDNDLSILMSSIG